MWKSFAMLIFLMVLCAHHHPALGDGMWGKFRLLFFCLTIIHIFFFFAYYTIAFVVFFMDMQKVDAIE